MTHFAALLTAFALVLAGSAGARSSDAPPSTPTGLVANAYSGTAGGIRWNRSVDDGGAVSGYEISRDGTVLDVRDALSYVDRALAPATTYTYGVTAIDAAGQRSGTATVSLRTEGGAPTSVLAAPTGLRASVYSSTAAEIFWTRPPTFGLRYEVLRDGESLVVTAGTSLFDDALGAGNTYTYDVVAIARDGRRSASSRITLRTFGGTQAGGPAAPTGLRASVYSATAAEIFWTRPPTFGLRYEVFRDDDRIATTDGTSYFDDTLSPNTPYTYDVIAIDAEGRRSASADISLTTSGGAMPADGNNPFTEPDPNGSSAIARLGFPAVLDSIDDLVSTAYLSLYYDIDPVPVALNQGNDPVENVTVACPGGGRASGDASFFTSDVVFERCAVDGVTLSGGLAREADFTVFGLGDVQTVNVTFEQLRIETSEGEALEVTGTSLRTDRRMANIECAGALTLSQHIVNRIEAARIESGSGVTTVTGASWMQRTEAGSRRTDDPLPGEEAGPPPPCTAFQTLEFEGSATLESSAFGAGTATLVKEGDIVRDARGADASSASARIEASFGDGSTLALTLTSDADATVQVDIRADGAAVSFADTYAFEAREDIPPILRD